MEDEDMVSPLVCAWDFVIPRETKKQVGNDTASLYLHVTLEGGFSIVTLTNQSLFYID